MGKIPKKVHYCWFGNGKKSSLMINCIESWKKFLPNYEIIEWNESNFDIKMNKFIFEAYKEKKWAYVTDYVRLYALFHEGGVYMDTDVEVLKNIDPFLEHSAFSGFEDIETIPTGLMGAEKGNLWIKDLLDYYTNKSFYNSDGKPDLTPNTKIITNMSIKYGFQANGKYQILDNDVHIYPKDYFCPKEHDTNKLNLTENSYCIHHFNGSWVDKNIKIKKKVIQIITSLIGFNNYKKIRNLLRAGKRDVDNDIKNNNIVSKK